MKPINDPYFNSVKNAAATRTYRLAARFGLPTAEREDIQQELILDMLERAHQFDPAKGSAGTFTGMVSEHRATELLDRLMKDRKRLTFGSGACAANDPDFDEFDESANDNVVPMWTDDRDLFADSMALRDLQKALAYMNDDQVTLFNVLAVTQDTPEACKASGMSTATFYRRVHELQMHLRMFGFRATA
ncbi:sigma factor [Rhodoferax antarcticus]|uniref:sigma factor n=1 Tax=Rhodoferax antarcticus TaxID=81479 RepID=UPI00222489FA|nr:sigma factor [Rhodoferax antarcticus]MCW2311473.1 DNA-directed RNA polymerase specialized sigma24 family protein [Rhodoferax antarcticus]